METIVPRLPKDLYPTILSYTSEYLLIQEERKWNLKSKILKLSHSMTLKDIIQMNALQHYKEYPPMPLNLEKKAIIFLNSPEMWTLIKNRIQLINLANSDYEAILSNLIKSKNSHFITLILEDMKTTLPRILLPLFLLTDSIKFSSQPIIQLISTYYNKHSIAAAITDSIMTAPVSSIGFIVREFDSYDFYQSVVDAQRKDLIEYFNLGEVFFIRKRKSPKVLLYESLREKKKINLPLNIKLLSEVIYDLSNTKSPSLFFLLKEIKDAYPELIEYTMDLLDNDYSALKRISLI